MIQIAYFTVYEQLLLVAKTCWPTFLISDKYLSLVNFSMTVQSLALQCCLVDEPFANAECWLALRLHAQYIFVMLLSSKNASNKNTFFISSICH